MTNESKVCTIDQSKRLVEHGVKDESYFTWTEIDEKRFLNKTFTAKKLLLHGQLKFGDQCKLKLWPAWDVAELGLLLPELSSSTWSEEFGYWIATNDIFESAIDREIISTKSEAIVRADLLLYLLDNNLITAR